MMELSSTPGNPTTDSRVLASPTPSKKFGDAELLARMQDRVTEMDSDAVVLGFVERTSSEYTFLFPFDAFLTSKLMGKKVNRWQDPVIRSNVVAILL